MSVHLDALGSILVDLPIGGEVNAAGGVPGNGQPTGSGRCLLPDGDRHGGPGRVSTST